MDIAAFVGFAAGGPFDLPVPIEDPRRFSATFGDDLSLAVDPSSGDEVFAQLGPAVREFFRNGGRRCWVVRAGAAWRSDGTRTTPGITTRFPVSGLVRRDGTSFTTVSLPARSPGSWADDVTVGAAIQSAPAQVITSSPTTVEIRFASPRTVQAGDLLRCRAGQRSVLAAVKDATQAPTGEVTVTLDLDQSLWTQTVDAMNSPPPNASATATFQAVDGSSRDGVTATLGKVDEHGRLLVDVDTDIAPVEGTLLQLDHLEGGDLLVTADAITSDHRYTIAGAAWWVISPEQNQSLAADSAEVLTLELTARQPGRPDARLGDLGFAPDHPRFIGNLPSDEQRYDTEHAGNQSLLATDAATADFPLAGDANTSDTLFPLDLAVLPTRFGAGSRQGADTHTRNGISDFGPSLFIDDDLADVNLDALAGTADFLRYQSSAPRGLRGMHAAMALDEVTILALPDAVQRGWFRCGDVATSPPTAGCPAPLPEVTAGRDVPHPDPAEFVRCGARTLLAPELQASPPDTAGRSTLRWTSTDTADAQYIAQGSPDPVNFERATTLYDGTATTIEVDAGLEGPFFRVRAHGPSGDSDWSNGVAIDAGRGPDALLAPESAYDAQALLAIHWAALRMCGGRGDLFAVLSCPGHWRENDAIAHARSLRSPELPSGSNGFHLGETSALAHGALYHPWTTVLLDGGPSLRRIPPDGPVAGVLADRAATRGAWVAPAAQPLRDVLALEPVLDRARLVDLQQARVNALRQEPVGFVCLDEDTLSADGDDDPLRPINVRRLIDLLRRLVTLHVPRYVFEPADARLRRRIQRGFEAVLRDLYSRGAFRGATTQEAFAVVSGSPPNTAQNVDQGQLIVELRVAASLPMRFLTVRLVQDAAGSTQVREPS
jgi:hypothetical protein